MAMTRLLPRCAVLCVGVRVSVQLADPAERSSDVADLSRLPAVGMPVVALDVIEVGEQKFAHQERFGRGSLTSKELPARRFPFGDDTTVFCTRLFGVIDAEENIAPPTETVGECHDGLTGLLVQTVTWDR